MKGFPEDLITYQPRSYPRELFSIAVYYFYLRLRKTNRINNLTLFLGWQYCNREAIGACGNHRSHEIVHTRLDVFAILQVHNSKHICNWKYLSIDCFFFWYRRTYNIPGMLKYVIKSASTVKNIWKKINSKR